MQAKFRRLMGIKGEGSTTAGQGGAQSQTNQLMENLEKEFERSRAFQLSRGAGGKSGIGLGYSGTWHRHNSILLSQARSCTNYELEMNIIVDK